jgi:transketolase
VPGHPEELERAFAKALAGDDRVYIRMSEESNSARVDGERVNVIRSGAEGAPFVLAVGPTLSATLEATRDRDVTVAYLSRVRPFDAEGLSSAVTGTDVILVEPYLAGTSSAEVTRALADRPHRLLALGVQNVELRRYGTWRDHRAAHGLDAAGIRPAIEEFLR